jgi:hypothetical protein
MGGIPLYLHTVMPPKKDKNPEESLQGSGEAVGAPPSSLASPAPGVGAPTRSRRKTTAAPPAAGTGKSKAVDKPAAASGSRGSNPAGAKKKTTAGASAKSDGAAAGKAKASESPSKSIPLEKPAVVGSGGTHGDESDVPPLWSVSNSSESESSIEEKRFTMPGFSAMPVNRQDFEEALGRAAASVTPSLASLV